MVNNILKRLREREVSSVNENSYSSLIGVLINDAKREVEDSWDWSALRTTLSVVTSADTFNYELNSSQNRMKVLDVVNDTDDLFMKYADAHWMNRMFLATATEKGSPVYYSFNGVSSDGDTLVDLYPIPDAAYTLRFNVVQREADLLTDSATTTVPTQPILLLAYAKAIEERGEDGGVGASSAYATANRSLNDAISLDAVKHPEELIWQEV
jgi:hypothetical protein